MRRTINDKLEYLGQAYQDAPSATAPLKRDNIACPKWKPNIPCYGIFVENISVFHLLLNLKEDR